MAFFDTHAHLEHARFEEDRQAVIARAASAGVSRILTCGSDEATSQASVHLARQHMGLYAAVGVHPHAASSLTSAPTADGVPWRYDAEALERLMALAQRPEVVAWGEIGLDYHYDFSPREAQRAALAGQLEAACELGLPVILHNRESDAELRAIVEAAPDALRGVLHCFLADGVMAAWALARGLYLGVGGPITFKSVTHLAEIVRQAPPERLLIETDCPYLAPHPQRGRRNEPAFVALVADKLAEILGWSVAEVAGRTTENACRLFGIG